MIEEYERLRSACSTCTKCPLCATRYQVVFDRGDPRSRLMLIGESPGANEDAQGEAFVGRAGQLLDELLEEAEIKDFIIANVIKCRPPENRFPGDAGSQHKEEIVNECLPWLDAQIELIRPKVIILVGHKAASWTIYRGRNAPPMKDLVGKWIRSGDYRNVELFAMYHTSYLLRTQNMDRDRASQIRSDTISVMKMAKRVMEGDLPDGDPLVVSATRPPEPEQLKFF